MYKVLIIAYYFPPTGLSGVQRTLKFVKYLPDFNWQPTVITTESIGYYAFDNTLLKELDGKDIEIIRVKGKEINSRLSNKGTLTIPTEFVRKTLSRISSLFFIPDNKISWSNSILAEATKLLTNEKFDLIFVTGPPFSSVNTAVKLKEQFKIPLVIDYRDLWYGYHFAKYITPYHSYKIKKMEYKALKASDKVIVINRRFKEKLMDLYKFLTFNDVVIIPQGYDTKDFEDAPKEVKPSKKMVLSYSGLFYEHITPKYFLNAFKMIVKEKPEIAADIQLHFIGIKRKETAKLIKKLNLESYVKEFGYLSHLDSISKIVMSDVLWLMIGNGKNSDTISSGKFFEYIGARKPIIGCVPDGTLKSALQEYEASFITPPDDVNAIKESIIKAYSLYTSGNLPKPNEDFVNKHRRDFLTDTLVKELHFLIKN